MGGIIIQFDLTKLDGLSSFHSVKSFLSQTQKISLPEDQCLHQELEEQIIKIIAADGKQGIAAALFLNARILDIAAILLRSLSSRDDPKNNSGKTHVLGKLDKAFQCLDANYQNEITLRNVSKSTCFSEYHFSRMFKEATEKNFHSYLNKYRIKIAEKMLINRQATITQVAHDCGFNSIVTFNRIFKKINGYSPSQYIKMHV